MSVYYCPIVVAGPKPEAALPIAGGPFWFTEMRVHRRDAAPEVISAVSAPSEVLDRLTASRADIAGLSMDRPRLMGILNVTPDSFSDGGQFNDRDAAVAQAQKMQAEGADIIDVGGESTRPGASEVPVDEEIARTAPVIAAIRAQSDVPISIDTRKAAAAQAAIEVGAGLINDVAALTFDPDLARVTADAGLPVCLMHAQGDPQTMQDDPRYDDVLLDVYDFLAARVAAAEAAGIPRDQIIVDPGIGFGKTVEHNLALLRGIALFHSLGCPILLGASRKRFIGVIGGGEHAKERVSGSVAVALHAARQGVQFLRVHDIFATKQALDLEWAISGAAKR
ncbi:dihydropteroate synthase [Cognatiyoonia sp. IB215182]|uniref:dihydropteroate synthase n=1 Tax=Cognatiyoonia sp. IB215182 TaxID=3097353 RepID=UPI002A0DC7A4|nr:dihydropteroate synthase [Cognatiyoonia sp. IB215182]MDX8351359.1 dihydropteroate synthase [Cognatiyoonia sp. IB215182]